MSAGRKLTEALQQGRALTDQRRKAQEMRVARAVENVRDGSCDSASDAAKGQKVPHELVNAALRRVKGMKCVCCGSEAVWVKALSENVQEGLCGRHLRAWQAVPEPVAAQLDSEGHGAEALAQWRDFVDREKKRHLALQEVWG